MAEFGVILLLFEVGLETDLDSLLESGRSSTIVAIGGFLGPFILGYIACKWFFNLPVLVSLFVGGTLTATSIGITVRTLTDLGKNNSREGQITLGAAVLDDVLGVILLAVLYDFAVHGEVSGGNVFRTIVFVGSFFLLAPVAAKYLSRLIQAIYKNHQSEGLIPTAMVSLCCFLLGLRILLVRQRCWVGLPLVWRCHAGYIFHLAWQHAQTQSSQNKYCSK